MSCVWNGLIRLLKTDSYWNRKLVNKVISIQEKTQILTFHASTSAFKMF